MSMGDIQNSAAGKGSLQLKFYLRKVFNIRCLQTWFPILIWLPKYNVPTALADITAGLAVGFTVVPQGLAYAAIAQLPIEYGLYSAFMSCFIYCLMGNSKDLTHGPTTILSLLTAQYGYQGSPLSAVWLTFMSGAIQLVLGILQMGFLVNFISTPVISGFTTAVAITIGFTQVKNLLGLSISSDDFVTQLSEIVNRISETKVSDAVLGLLCIISLIFLKHIETKKWGDEDTPHLITKSQKVARLFLSCMATGRNAIIILISAVMVATNPDINFTRTKNVRQGLPSFHFPDFSAPYKNGTITAKDIFEKVGVGFVFLPLIGILELIATVKVLSVQNKYTVNHSQEIITLGICNLLSSFVSSYPVTASMTRSVINSQSSVRTPAGGIVTGVIVLLALGILSRWFTYIPKSALAAVVLVSVSTMINLRIIVKIFRVMKSNLIPLFLTLLVAVFYKVEYGILVGIGISIFILIYPMARPKLQVTTKLGFPIVQPDGNILFPAVEYFKDTMKSMAISNFESSCIVLDCIHMSKVDYSFIQGLSELIEEFTLNSQKIILINLKHDLMGQIDSANICGFECYPTLKEALHFKEDSESAVEESLPLLDTTE